ncbi:EmmdR/YeeO family multidrug/toxin efflux MATE transporter, partial [Salmonella enterica]|nr:EmmdR/YeeO family multidrug/toxin efflux MATE transporter [Salmonella enterica]EHG6659210.1 EmmdR/YeeO family multidrug/toxin efflux MATE transporter [Salmonella enterica subsp. enterica serovar Enteritidis]
MWFQLSSLRSILNVSTALRQAVVRTPWYAKRKSYKVLFWREITPLAIPIFLENTCVLLMGVLSTFLVSWLGKEAMAGVGLADSFNMVIMAFFAAIDLGTTVVVAFSLGKRDRRRARAAARQSLVIMTLFAVVLAVVIHYFGSEIINIVAGEATSEVKGLALTYLELTVLSYPAAAIALIGSGALRGAGNTKIPLMINGGMNILNIIISSILIYGAFSWQGLGFAGAGLGLTISRYIGAVAIIWVLMIGFNPALRIPLKSYLKPLNFGIIWEVMGIGIPASIESVLFNGGKLLTQMFVAGMGTNVIAGNFIAFSVAALINLPGNALGSASTIITGKRLGTGQIGQAERQLRHVFWMSTIVLT